MSCIIPCHELYGSPEFIAFARKIGIPWEQGVRNLLIIMPMDGYVEVLMDFQGSPPEEVASRKRMGDEILARSGLVGDPPQIVFDDRVDTTTGHNQRVRTWLAKESGGGVSHADP